MSEFNQPATGRRFLTGPRVVASMFAMGICATAFLYGYWTLHLMPFMPLQEAIVAEFPGSSPRVDGGKKRMHKDTPTILRIVMKSQINPTGTDADSVNAMLALRKRIAELVDAKVDFPGMNFIELHVYQLLQEKEILEKSWRLDVQANSDWIELDEDGNPVIRDARFPDRSGFSSPSLLQCVGWRINIQGRMFQQDSTSREVAL